MDDMNTMKSVVLKKPYSVGVERRKIPVISDVNDVVIRTLFAGICGSDLHIYSGSIHVPSVALGHESVGIIEEVGEGVRSLAKGDLVVIPFDIGCGFCDYCRIGETAFCETSNSGKCGHEYSGGDITGAQSEFLRVPYADFNVLKVKDLGTRNIDYIFLSDNLSTGWNAVVETGLQPGDSIVIFGAGSVGLLSAYSSKLLGASRVFIVDSDKNRLKKAEEIGIIPIDYKNENVLETILNENEGALVDRGIDAVGRASLVQKGSSYSSIVIDQLLELVKNKGSIYLAGVYPIDLNLILPFSKIYFKGIKINSGKTSVHKYYRSLLRLIETGAVSPSHVVQPTIINIDDAPEAYIDFYNHKGNLTKPVIRL